MQSRTIHTFAGPLALFACASLSLGCLLSEYTEAEGDCTPGQSWASQFGGLLTDSIQSAAPDACGGVTVGGDFQSFVDFGLEAPLEAAQGSDGYVARFDAVGNVVWIIQFGDDGDQKVKHVAADIFGSAIAAGEFTSKLLPPGGKLVTNNNDVVSAFITKVDLFGAHEWTKTFRESTGTYPTTVCGVAVDRTGNVTIAGDFKGKVDFGGYSQEGMFEKNIFVAHFDPAGTVLWTKSFQTERGAECHDLAADKDGNLLMTGTYSGPIDFGGGPHDGPAEGVDGVARYYVLKMSAAGERIWSQGTNKGNYQDGTAIASDSAGNVIVAGVFHEQIPLPEGEISSVGSSDIFIKKLAPDGAPLWGKTFGGTSADTVGVVAINADGHIVIGGTTFDTIDFEQTLFAQQNYNAGTMMYDKTIDPFIATLDGFDGAPITSRIFKGPDAEYVTALALDPEGLPIVGATFVSAINIGTDHGVFTSDDNNEGNDFFLAKLKPLDAPKP